MNGNDEIARDTWPDPPAQPGPNYPGKPTNPQPATVHL